MEVFFIKEEKLTLEEYKKLRNISMKLIQEYHKDDVDKGGNPYIYHLLSVSNSLISTVMVYCFLLL